MWQDKDEYNLVPAFMEHNVHLLLLVSISYPFRKSELFTLSFFEKTQIVIPCHMAEVYLSLKNNTTHYNPLIAYSV